MSVQISGLSQEDVELIVAALRVTAGTVTYSQGLDERRRCMSLADRIDGGLTSEQRRGELARRLAYRTAWRVA